MSGFACQKCGAVISDSPTGYVTGCEHWPVDKLENVTERAAIMEYDAGMTRELAEAKARQIVENGNGEKNGWG